MQTLMSQTDIHGMDADCSRSCKDPVKGLLTPDLYLSLVGCVSGVAGMRCCGLFFKILTIIINVSVGKHVIVFLFTLMSFFTSFSLLTAAGRNN